MWFCAVRAKAILSCAKSSHSPLRSLILHSKFSIVLSLTSRNLLSFSSRSPFICCCIVVKFDNSRWLYRFLQLDSKDMKRGSRSVSSSQDCLLTLKAWVSALCQEIKLMRFWNQLSAPLFHPCLMMIWTRMSFQNLASLCTHTKSSSKLVGLPNCFAQFLPFLSWQRLSHSLWDLWGTLVGASYSLVPSLLHIVASQRK